MYNWRPRQALGERLMTVGSMISIEHPIAEIYVALTGGWLLPETLPLSLPMAKRASLKRVRGLGFVLKEEAVPIWEPDVSLQAVSWGLTVQNPEESTPGDPVTHRLKCDFTDGSEMAISKLESWPGENPNIHENSH